MSTPPALSRATLGVIGLAGLLAAPALWVTYTWGSHVLALGAHWRGRRSDRVAALTFDDGPDETHTPQVLDVLARERVQGTFFLIGERAARAQDIARRIASEGHDLGNHTWSHRSLWCCGPAETWRQIERGHDAIARAAGRAPVFFRPPWGMTNLAMFAALPRLGTPCVFWTVQAEGRRPVPAARQRQRALDRIRPGAILDLHDADGVPGAGARLVEALPGLVRGLRDEGYALCPLREIL